MALDSRFKQLLIVQSRNDRQSFKHVILFLKIMTFFFWNDITTIFKSYLMIIDMYTSFVLNRGFKK
ncbi:hypothetical protein RhiirB3_5894 [Rhizophagus irregularis]|nr:hypothetical protein RhiirB3_5894 [Rhizophagus irregularis]